MTQAHIESIAREARTELGPVEVCCLGGEARVLRLGAQAVELSDDHLMSDIGDAEAPSVLWDWLRARGWRSWLELPIERPW